jgi:hypothetical protein
MITVTLFDFSGKRVKQLFNGPTRNGTEELTLHWDGRTGRQVLRIIECGSK